MHDAPFVGRRERAGNLCGDPGGFVEGQVACRQPLGERHAFDLLHHEVVVAVVVADVEQRADVRMVQRGDRLRLALQALAGAELTRQLRRQDLDCDRASEAGVLRTVDLAHAALP